MGQGGSIQPDSMPRRTDSVVDSQPPRIMAMEACATSRYWGRIAQCVGNDVRLVPPTSANPFVRRQKNDAAAPIAEVTLPPKLHCVQVKSAEHQPRAVAIGPTSASSASAPNGSTLCVAI